VAVERLAILGTGLVRATELLEAQPYAASFLPVLDEQ
jgi:hypothetical protein